MSEGWIPPAHSSLSNAAEEIQLLASTTDDGDRDMNNLLRDGNNQRLSSLSERLSSLGGEKCSRATSALRDSTRHNVQVSKLKKKKRDQPAGKTWWLNCLIL